jgi:hypothetical protein
VAVIPKSQLRKATLTLWYDPTFPHANCTVILKPGFRNDFFYSCAYCTMSEAEAQATRFTVDHYEPKNAQPDLINAYDNLMLR